MTKKEELIKTWADLGKEWMTPGSVFTEVGFLKDKPAFKFSEKQKKFFNSKQRYCLYSGGFGCGKTLVLILKMVSWCLFFPGTKVLLGKQFISDIEKIILPDLFRILPSTWYSYGVKAGIVKLFNGSEIILFGLDAFQGSGDDIKKAEQKIKGLNLSAYFIDQLEEVEENVFEALNARLRSMDAPLSQGNMTCNPANFWAYQFFKVNSQKREDIELVEGSMADNKANLPPTYIPDRTFGKDQDYINRYVLGIWEITTGVGRLVFNKNDIIRLEAIQKEPVDIDYDCEIYEQPKLGMKYQMGVDSSEGSVDPSSISIVSLEGRKVARFNAKVPIPALGDKILYLYRKYYSPLIIPEVNAAGMALLEYIRDLNVYQRTVVDTKDNTETKKLGWKTSHSTKQALISNFKDLLRYGFPQIYDKNTILEMKTFVWSDEARQQGAGAERGMHDDDVISTLLSFWGLVGYATPQTAIEKEMAKFKRVKKQQTYI
jgi:hypothetical protein